MRIVAGKFRSRQLKSVGKLDLRPTSDRLRETLFNVLAADVEGSVFIDCFAGTGAVGIEALSRGARRVIFVEKHPPTAALIFANLKSLGVDPETSIGDGTAGAEILTTNAGKGLLRLASQNVRADILFADPPYAEIGMCVKALERATASRNYRKITRRKFYDNYRTRHAQCPARNNWSVPEDTHFEAGRFDAELLSLIEDQVVPGSPRQ